MNASRRVEVLGGTGTVHREDGLVCWFAPGFPPDRAAAVLEAVRSGGAGELVPSLTAALAGSPAALCVVREDAGSLAVALQGHVVVSEDGAERLRGSEGGGLAQADLVTAGSLTVRGGVDPDQLDRPGTLAFDLRHGTVPGGGVTYWPAPPRATEAAPVLDDHVVLFDLSTPERPREPLPVASVVVAPSLELPVSEPAPVSPPVAAVPAAPAGQHPTEVVVGSPAGPSPAGGSAAAVVETAVPGAGPAMPGAPLVRGVHCARGHFNNPRALYCGICGLAMVQKSLVLVEGPRPPLGVLLSDDGNAYSLDGDYVLGRQPELSEDVIAARARPLKVDDRTGRVSRVHARVGPQDWEVIVTDLGSHNGTQLFNPGDTGWRTLRGDESVALQPGGRLIVGQSTFEFQSIQRQ